MHIHDMETRRSFSKALDDPAAERGGREEGVVLLVDDDEDLLESLAALLGTLSVPVVAARSVAEAKGILDTGEVDVLVTDFELGPEDGARLLSYAAARWPRVARILFSGSPIAPGAQAHAVVAKPEIDVLLRMVRALLPAGGARD
jgi:DNA-binding NtrC family response regulator